MVNQSKEDLIKGLNYFVTEVQPFFKSLHKGCTFELDLETETFYIRCCNYHKKYTVSDHIREFIHFCPGKIVKITTQKRPKEIPTLSYCIQERIKRHF
jgi:hypothetical protein